MIIIGKQGMMGDEKVLTLWYFSGFLRPIRDPIHLEVPPIA